MPARPAKPQARRLRWALLIALALHLLLLLRAAPSLFGRLQTSSSAVTAEEQIVEITPPPPPPKSAGLQLASQLGSASPEPVPVELPADFFTRTRPAGRDTLSLAGDFDFARASGLQIVANIVPAATVALRPGRSERPQRPKSARVAEASAAERTPAPAPLLAAETAEAAAAAAAAAEENLGEAEVQVPLLAPAEPAYDVDAAIARAAQSAEASARAAQNNSLGARTEPDYRALLPQGPVVPPPPLPLGGDRRASSAEVFERDDGLRAAPEPEPARRMSAEEGRALAVARQQFLGTLTARLKATNVRMLAEAVKAGPKAKVRMKFLVDREGRVLELTPAEPASERLVERATAVIRAARLPPVPAAMTAVPVELSFPVEVYR